MRIIISEQPDIFTCKSVYFLPLVMPYLLLHIFLHLEFIVIPTKQNGLQPVQNCCPKKTTFFLNGGSILQHPHENPKRLFHMHAYHPHFETNAWIIIFWDKCMFRHDSRLMHGSSLTTEYAQGITNIGKM
jgi:hypothetical protein